MHIDFHIDNGTYGIKMISREM